MPEGKIPKRVEKLVLEIEKKNPKYGEAQAWATAWSVYCKYIKPGSSHCHKSASEYLSGGKQQRGAKKTKTRKKTQKTSAPKPTGTVSATGMALMSDGSWKKL